MNPKLKRFLSMFLAITMVLGSSPVTVFAESPSVIELDDEMTGEPADIVIDEDLQTNLQEQSEPEGKDDINISSDISDLETVNLISEETGTEQLDTVSNESADSVSNVSENDSEQDSNVSDDEEIEPETTEMSELDDSEQEITLVPDSESVTSEVEESESEVDSVPSDVQGEENLIVTDDGYLLFDGEDTMSEEDEEVVDITSEDKFEEPEWRHIFEEESKGEIPMLDFSSMRLILGTENPDVIIDKENILSEYNGIYLLQYTSMNDAIGAYMYYANRADFVEPDTEVKAADEENVLDEMTEETNPLAELEIAVEENTPVEISRVIALIDTGVNNADVVNSVSMLGDDTFDENGHGTNMFDIIKETNPNANVMSIKALDKNGKGTISSIYAAIQYAIEMKSDVIAMPLYAISTAENAALADAIRQATDAGIVVVGAAGNDGRNVRYYTPGNITDAIIVGACDAQGQRISSSNYGDTVDYNVIADSTSEATAKMAAVVVKNIGVLDYSDNEMIFRTDYVPITDITDGDSEDNIDITGNENITNSELYYNGKLISEMTLEELYAAYKEIEQKYGELHIYENGTPEEIAVVNAFLKYQEEDEDYLNSLFTVADKYTKVTTRGQDLVFYYTGGGCSIKYVASNKRAAYCVRHDWESQNGAGYEKDSDVTKDDSEIRTAFSIAIRNGLRSMKKGRRATNSNYQVENKYGDYMVTQLAIWHLQHLYPGGNEGVNVENIQITGVKPGMNIPESKFKTIKKKAIQLAKYAKREAGKMKKSAGQIPYGTDPPTMEFEYELNDEMEQSNWAEMKLNVDKLPTNADGTKYVTPVISVIIDEKEGELKETYDVADKIKLHSPVSWVTFVKDGNRKFHFEISKSYIDGLSEGEYGFVAFSDATFVNRAAWTHFAKDYTPPEPQALVWLTDDDYPISACINILIKKQGVKKYGLQIEKISAEPEVTDNNNNYSLNGTKFEVYGPFENSVSPLTSDNVKAGNRQTGTIKIDKKLTGTTHEVWTNSKIFEVDDVGIYYAIETKSGAGFKPDAPPLEIKVTENNAFVGDVCTNPAKSSQQLKNYPEPSYFYVKKMSTVEDLVIDNPYYSLTGAKFGVYTNPEATVAYLNNNNKPVVLTAKDEEDDVTAETDPIKVPLDTYYVQETKRPKGYLRNTEIASVKTTKKNNSEENAAVVNIKDMPMFTTLKIKKENNAGEALKGAQYTVRWSAGGLSETWVIKTDEDGIATLDTSHKVSGSSFFFIDTGDYEDFAENDDESEELSTLISNITNRTGVLPLGDIEVEETKAPSGYKRDTTVYKATIRDPGDETATVPVVTWKNANSNFKYDSNADAMIHKEESLFAGVKVYKKDKQTGKAVPLGDANFEGIEFTIKRVGPGTSYSKGDSKSFKAGDVVTTIKTDANGYAATAKDALQAGFSYSIQETKSNGTYQLTDTRVINFDITDEDADALKDVLPGSGFLNTVVPENIYLQKKDVKNTTAQGDASLAGIKMAIVNRSAANVVVGNSTTEYEPGKVIAVLTTDANGKTPTIKVPYGTYEGYELRADSKVKVGDVYANADKGTSAMANDSMKWSGTSDKQVCHDTTGNKTYEFNIANDPLKGGIHIYKADKDLGVYVPQGDASLAGIKFAVVNRSKNAVYVGGTKYNVGQVVYVLTTNENGQATLTGLPYGTYEVFEQRMDSTIVAGDTYNTATAKYGKSGLANASYKYDGSKHPSLPVHTEETINKGFEFVNPVSTEDVSVQKKDYKNTTAQGDASLAGIKFAVINRSKNSVVVAGATQAAGKIVGILTTKADGTTNKLTLPYGTYQVVELRKDATIAVGNVYDSSEAKYGTSILANDSMLWNNYTTTRALHSPGETLVLDVNDIPVKGAAHVFKGDFDKKNFVPQGDGSLAGIKFAIVNRSANPIYVSDENGDKKYEVGSVVRVLTTNENGQAKTPTELVYGTYDIIELRADSTIKAGDMFDTATAKYGTSIYANPSYYYEANKETFKIRHQDEVAGEKESDDKYNNGKERLHYDNKVVRGGLHLYKKDYANGYTPEGDATLAGIRFAVVNDSKEGVHVNGKLYKPGQVVLLMETNAAGEAVTQDEVLPYGTYDVIELRADSTIAVGDIYADATDKYGTSIYANNAGAEAAEDHEHSSMLFAAMAKQVLVRKAHEMVGEGKNLSNDGTKTETFDDTRLRFENKPAAGGLHIYKADLETKNFEQDGTTYTGYTAQGDATLAGIRFAVTNRSLEAVYVDGVKYENGQVVTVLTTNEDGEAWTPDEYLPYGTYDVDELRADSTIEAGDAYSEATDKYGESIYANNSGNPNAAGSEGKGSMLYAGNHEKVTIRHNDETPGEKESDEKFNDGVERLHFENRVVRGGFELYKVDKETMISYALGGASLKDIQFTLKNVSEWNVFIKNAKYPDGHVYAPGEVIDDETTTNAFWTTDKYGRVFASANYLPYGSYEIKETATNKSYMKTDEEPRVFHIREEGVIVGEDEDRVIRTKEEAEAAGLVVPNQVVRADFQFNKKDENGRVMKNIPWAITNITTGETHYILTDANGEYSSRTDKTAYSDGIDTDYAKYAPHTKNTNAYDEVLRAYDESGEQIPQSVIDELVSTYDYGVGTWFGLSQDILDGAEGTMAEPDDTLGAFPYGNYTIRELKTDANARKMLVDDSFYVYKNNVLIDYGTIDNEPITLKTMATNDATRDHTGLATETAKINDLVTYTGLDTAAEYRLVAELHYVVTAENGTKLDGGIITDADGKEVRAEKELKPESRDGYTTMALTFNATAMKANGTAINGDTVVFEYLYKVLEDGTEKLAGTHADPTDEDQTITWPQIETQAVDDQTGTGISLARKDLTIVDHVDYHNLTPGKTYVMKGRLMDKETGEPAKDDNGKAITAESTFTPKEADGTVTVTFVFDGVSLAGKSVVAFESCEQNGVEFAVHTDINDDDQTVDIPKIRTTAEEAQTESHVGSLGTERIIDTVDYENLPEGLTYIMKGTLMVKETGEPLVIEGEPVTAEKEFESEGSGQVTMEFFVTGQMDEELTEKTFVVFEECVLKAGQIGEGEEKDIPAEDTTVAEHKDIDDEDQSIHYPGVYTTATDELTADHVGTVGTTSVKDDVHLTNLVVGETYKVKGTLIRKDGNAPQALLDKEGNPYEAEAEVKADSMDMVVTLTFEVDASQLRGNTVVAFEKLFYINPEIGTEVEVGSHENPDDEDQSVHYPKIRTLAADKHTESHTGTILEGLSEEKGGLTDTVLYENLVEGETYTIRGTLMNKATGEPLTDAKGAAITAEETFTAQKAEGTISLNFKLDTSLLKDATVVAFEKLFHNNKETGEEVEVDRHEDIEDEDQSVHQPDIYTTATDPKTGSHTGTVTGTSIIDDAVILKNLVKGSKYTVTGTLYDQAAEKQFLDKDKKPFTTTVEFKAEESDIFEVTGENGNRIDGVVHVRFTVDSSLLAGTTVVTFEDLYHNGVKVVSHADINDKEQSVYYPSVRTTAVNADTEAKTVQAGIVKIKDVVAYTNLTVGKTYTVSGTLMNKKTGKAVKTAKGENVTATTKFTAKSADGSVELTFEADATTLAGVTVVAFEKLFVNDEPEEGTTTEIANHEDLNDEDQSVKVIDIRTTAVDSESKTHEGQASEKTVIIDRVKYTGLTVGEQYTMSGRLMDKETGKAVAEKAQTFTATAENGTVELTFEVNTAKLAGHKLVAFEKLLAIVTKLDGTKKQEEIATHEDLNDEDQTVDIIDIKTNAKDVKTGTHEGEADVKLTIEDEVTYTGLTPGASYVMKGYLINKETQKAISKVVSKPFKPEKADGSVVLSFTIDSSKLAGSTAVAFEELYRVTDGKEKKVAEHKNPEDKDQSVNIVSIKTNAKDVKSDAHAGQADVKQTIKDVVTYTGLTPKASYIMKGQLMDKETKKSVGEAVSKPFKPEKADGSVELEFTIDSSKLAGHVMVAFEELYKVEDKKETKIAEHKDIEDKDQSVSIVEIKTNAKDVETGTHEGAAAKKQTIKDVVTYTGLTPNASYIMKGQLMDKETKKSVGEAVSKPFKPEKADGSVELEFTINSSKLAGHVVVAFEELYTVEEGKEKKIAEHKDINDEDQSVSIAKIRTTLTDKEKGGHTATVGEKVTLVDTVKYEGLVGGSYTVKGELYDKSTKKSIGVTAQKTFDAKNSGSVTLEFQVDTKKYAGKKLVAFEKLYDKNGKLIATHEDINDEDQTVSVPGDKVTPTPTTPGTPGNPGTPTTTMTNVKTGDTRTPLLFAGMAAAAALVLAFAFRKKKKKN